MHSFAARPANILERGVQRHPADAGLWRDYLEQCSAAAVPGDAKKRTTKRWRKGMASALRMLPAEPALWVMAGRRAMEDGDWEGMRSVFLRGCRFCKMRGGEAVWVEFARGEMRWLERAERKGRGKKQAKKALQDDGAVEEILFDSEGESDDDAEDRFLLPEPTKDDAASGELEISTAVEGGTPALEGAIPESIFKAATKEKLYSPHVGTLFFETFAAFPASSVSARDRLMQVVLDDMDETYPQHAATVSCHVRQPIAGVDVFRPEFARGMRTAVERLWMGLESTTDKMELVARTRGWVDQTIGVEGLDHGIARVLEVIGARLDAVESAGAS